MSGEKTEARQDGHRQVGIGVGRSTVKTIDTMQINPAAKNMAGDEENARHVRGFKGGKKKKKKKGR